MPETETRIDSSFEIIKETQETYVIYGVPEEPKISRLSLIRYYARESDESLILEFNDGYNSSERIYGNPENPSKVSIGANSRLSERISGLNPKILNDVLEELSPRARSLLEAALKQLS